MNTSLATALPIASAWMLLFMLIVAIVLLPIFPFILRRRRRKAQQELHDQIQKAKAHILEDGIVEGPKGPYVRHQSWDVGTETRTPRDGPPRATSYHGGPWPRA